MRWGEAKWLYWLWLIPVLAVWAAVQRRHRLRAFEAFIDRKLWTQVIPALDLRLPARKQWFFLISVAFMFLALARPQWGEVEETVKLTGMDIVIALDLSNSMLTEDISPSRQKKAIHVVRGLIDRLKGDRVGIVGFAGSAFLAVPLTTDYDYVLETVQALSPQSVQFQGTNIGAALEVAAGALERGRESAAVGASVPSRAVILISDGEDLENEAVAAAKTLKENGAILYTLGVGTLKGGPIPVRDENGNLVGYKKNGGREPVLSRFKPDALQTLSDKSGGKYWTITPAENELDDLTQNLGGLTRGDLSERKVVSYRERYQYPLAISVICLLLELSLSARKILSLGFLMFSLFGSGLAYRAQAEETREAPLSAIRENEKGLTAYRQGKFDEAKRRFGSAQAIKPDSPALRYNQGVIQSELGDTDRAIEGFSDSAKQARAVKDFGLSARSHYNLGTLYAKKDQPEKSIESLIQALDDAKKSKDQTLEDTIRRRLIQEQSQSGGKSKDQSDKKNPDPADKKDSAKKDQGQSGKSGNEPAKADPSKPEEKPGDEEGEDKKEEAKKFEDPSQSRRKARFKSEKLSSEDADRVMAELLNREKELQRKLNQKRTRQGEVGKDW